MHPPRIPKGIDIALLPGDGIGPQLAVYAKQTLEVFQRYRPHVSFNVTELPFGGAALAAGESSALPLSTLNTCRQSDAVILCGCGDTNYDLEPEKALLALRKNLGVHVNVRPVSFPSDHLAQHSAYKSDIVQNLDIIFIRDLAGGIYYGRKKEADDGGEAYDTTEYSRQHIERLARWAGTYAMGFDPPKRVHSVDKFNVMATSRLWRSVVTRIFEAEFPAVPLDHVLVDTAAMILASDPTALNGIILTENMFGDILSDQAGAILRSQESLASASISALPRQDTQGSPGIFEPLNLKPRPKLQSPLCILESLKLMLDLSFGLVAESEAIARAVRRTMDPVELIGSDARTADFGGSTDVTQFMRFFLEHLEFYLEAINSIEMASQPTQHRSPHRQTAPIYYARYPMNLIEKIMTHAGVGLQKPNVRSGEMVCVKVDWTITSELLWAGMEKTYDLMGRPRPYRNDRLWLAVDHTVDPRTNDQPRQRGLIEKAEKFKYEAKIIDFLPANTSIMHTDFTRERAQPGRIVVGSDSHTCSAGSMGSFAIGFGAADVVMPMVTGETWFRVPEVCRINFVGTLPYGVGGKDVILHLLGLFKRNTIAFQRAVEYGGPGISELSMDARFAIANMTTEFGGMGACFEADMITAAWISHRENSEHRGGGLYFKPDDGARYAEQRTVDLSEVGLTIALYPDPDNVVPVTTKSGMNLDGCFIGACTTTEEDLILAALVLEAGLRMGKIPVSTGQRRVTPGSLRIIKNLERHGLLNIYKQAGFDVGAPGCSYCVGINDVDVAGEGETWLSSQNRNFRNRMGKGSFGNVTCAAVVAASSFTMEVTDARPFLQMIDEGRLQKFIGDWKNELMVAPEIHEPSPEIDQGIAPAMLEDAAFVEKSTVWASNIVESNIQYFAENVDT